MKCTPQKNSDCLNGVKQSILFLFATLLLLKTFSLVQNTSIISIQSSVISTEEISNWIVEVSQKSSVLLNNLILNDYCFGNRYIQNLITKEKWIELEKILQYVLMQKEQVYIISN